MIGYASFEEWGGTLAAELSHFRRVLGGEPTERPVEWLTSRECLKEGGEYGLPAFVERGRSERTSARILLEHAYYYAFDIPDDSELKVDVDYDEELSEGFCVGTLYRRGKPETLAFADRDIHIADFCASTEEELANLHRRVQLAAVVAGEDSRPVIFVGMPDAGDFDPQDPIGCVATFAVEFPMDLDDWDPENRVFNMVRVEGEADLRRWAQRNFTHYDIR